MLNYLRNNCRHIIGKVPEGVDTKTRFPSEFLVPESSCSVSLKVSTGATSGLLLFGCINRHEKCAP